MSLGEKLALPLLGRMDPERAHRIAMTLLRRGLAPGFDGGIYPRLHTRVAGLDLPNPLGLAAGFDKNAEAVPALGKSGFGFIEVGAATPLPQPGNPKPRMFRLREDNGAINRFGFNNDGAEAIARRLAASATKLPLGLNLGANKDSEDRSRDFGRVLAVCGDHIDFATVNISSPNTEKLRDLQGKSALDALLADVMQSNRALEKPVPIFLKISPDLSTPELEDIAEVASGAGISAIIATNTTLDRSQLQSAAASQKGGLSGQPLFERSTRILARLSTLTSIPLIGVGGISSGEQAYIKIRAGASAVQLYTALAYHGMGLVARILADLDQMLERDGFARISDAVGTDRDAWL